VSVQLEGAMCRRVLLPYDHSVLVASTACSCTGACTGFHHPLRLHTAIGCRPLSTRYASGSRTGKRCTCTAASPASRLASELEGCE
jgi:hypothetical protein